MKQATPSDRDDRRTLDLSGVVYGAVDPLVPAYRPMSRRLRATCYPTVISKDIVWGHNKLKAPPKNDNMKRATTSDHDSRKRQTCLGVVYGIFCRGVYTGSACHRVSPDKCILVPPAIVFHPINIGGSCSSYS